MHFVVLLSALVAFAACVPFSSTGPKPEGRIWYGTETDIKEIPYQLSLSIDGHFTCGAVIIDKAWALKAAHCYEGEAFKRITLRAGSIYTDKSGSLHNATNVIVHDRFNRTGSLEHNIALLQGHPAFSEQDAEKSIHLYGRKSATAHRAYISGWRMTENGHKSTKLRRAVVRIQPPSACCKSSACFTEDVLCAIGDAGQAPGEGDSGGPLVHTREGTLIGLVSQRITIDSENTTGIYTSIPALKTRIQTKKQQ